MIITNCTDITKDWECLSRKTKCENVECCMVKYLVQLGRLDKDILDYVNIKEAKKCVN